MRVVLIHDSMCLSCKEPILKGTGRFRIPGVGEFHAECWESVPSPEDAKDDRSSRADPSTAGPE
jgi:hypothetical protein